MSHASWLNVTVSPYLLVEITNRLSCEIIKRKTELNLVAIAVTGVSGLVVGGAVSMITGIPLVVVRKGESRHSGHDVECLDDLEGNYVFIDDLISSGDTLNRVVESIKKEEPKLNPKLVILYNGATPFTGHPIYNRHPGVLFISVA